jgi:hypothetical protein
VVGGWIPRVLFSMGCFSRRGNRKENARSAEHAGQGEGSLSLSLHLVLLLVGLGIDVASRARHASASSGELVVEHGGGGTEGNARRGNVGGGSRRHAPRVDAQRCPADGGADSEHSLCRGVV